MTIPTVQARPKTAATARSTFLIVAARAFIAVCVVALGAFAFGGAPSSATSAPGSMGAAPVVDVAGTAQSVAIVPAAHSVPAGFCLFGHHPKAEGHGCRGGGALKNDGVRCATNAIVDGAGGAATGGVVGGVVGSAVPGIGTGSGAAGGAVVGGVLGAYNGCSDVYADN